MITTELLQDLYQHMAWADALVWNHVPDVDTDSPDQELLERFVHVHNTQTVFRQVWNGEPMVMKRPDDFSTLSEVLEYARPFYEAIPAELSGVIDTKSLTPVPWVKYFERSFGGKAEITTLGETMLQVAMHTQYHRGQINTRLRALGVKPPLVDYIAWVWQGRPGADW